MAVAQTMTSDSRHQVVLARAVSTIGGQGRPGQEQMADAVAQSLDDGVHLLVQAGTGTGKSLGYLVPSVLWAMAHDETVIVATATLALQNQLATKDIPVVSQAIEQVTGRRPRFQVVKGRANHACLFRVREQTPEQDSLFDSRSMAAGIKRSGADHQSVIGAEMVALREWVERQADTDQLADRDDAPPHSAQAWAQVSSSARQCVGASRCPLGDECFTEKARERARQADLVITNHVLLAISAMTDASALPSHGAVVIDEAHELTDRVTSAASTELAPAVIRRAAREAAAWIDDDLAVALEDAADGLNEALRASDPGQITDSDDPVVAASAVIQAVARRCVSALNEADTKAPQPELVQAQSTMKEVFDTAARVAALDGVDVVWVSAGYDASEQDRQVNTAPLSVAGLLREKVLGQATTILTSATLSLGGSFDAMAGSVGLQHSARLIDQDAGEDEWTWRGIDVGSPFDYPRQGILYLARHLRPPSREGIGDDALAEARELIAASGGDALGLFTSQRAAQAAAEYLRQEFPEMTILCQGDEQLPELTRRFLNEPGSCLVGTLSLWQGIDIPGQACRLVIVDRLPFPRPDDPLMQARQQAVSKSGGNGFMQVAATHAALLLAQGSGRLIRRASDRGVVAVLDPRLVTARYGSYLLRSMPQFWRTEDRDVALAALARLAELGES